MRRSGAPGRFSSQDEPLEARPVRVFSTKTDRTSIQGACFAPHITAFTQLSLLRRVLNAYAC
jgi:hypothetical protein